MRKTLPLENVLNRLVAKAVADRMSAINVRRDTDDFSSPEAAERVACEFDASARALELMAIEVMEWQKGPNRNNVDNHIFYYHTKPSNCELSTHVRLKTELEEKHRY